MERVAVAFTDEIRACGVDLSQVLIVCGSGNNGGDGLAIARILKLAGYEADIVLAAGHKGKASEANQIQQEMITAYGWELLTRLPEGKQYTAVIDAVFGVGLSRSVEGNYRQLLEDMNRLSGAKIAVDIASGISADSGEILGVAFRADMTITFAYEKIGMRLFPGAEYSGEIRVKDIGIGELSWLERKPAVAAFTDEDLTFLAERTAHSHKGTYGKSAAGGRKCGYGRCGLPGGKRRLCIRARSGACGDTGRKSGDFTVCCAGSSADDLFGKKTGYDTAYGGTGLGRCDCLRSGAGNDGCRKADCEMCAEKCRSSGTPGCGCSEFNRGKYKCTVCVRIRNL